jgi:peptidyl-prolyl cis-trans isomerase C
MSQIRFTIPIFVLLCAGLCFPQAAPKTPAAKAKTSTPGTDTASGPAAQPPDDDAVPAENPNALFPSVVAKVDGKPILGRDLEREVRRQLAPIGNPEWKDLREDYRGQLLYASITGLINTNLLYRKALASGYQVAVAEIQDELQKISKTFNSDAEMNAALADQNIDRPTLEKQIYRALLVSKFMDEAITKKISITQEEIAKYYAANPKDFQHPDLVRTSHILLKAGENSEQDALAKQRAEALLARVKKGEDFAKLAKENSIDSTASVGGDVGFSAKDSTVAGYGEAAFALPVGGITLIKTQLGYHIIKVTERKKEGLSTLEEVKPALTDFLKSEKQQAELTKLINQLRDQAKIEILIPAGQPLKP